MTRPDDRRVVLVGERRGVIWGEWRSRLHDEVEVRPWTPLRIGSEVAYIARDAGASRMFWGEWTSPPFDDLCDTLEHEGEPVCIARKEMEYRLLRPGAVTQAFPFQVSFRVDEGLHLFRFGDRARRALPVVWTFAAATRSST